MDQIHIALLCYFLFGFSVYKCLRILKVDEYRRSGIELSCYLFGLCLVGLIGDGVIGFERPGYFEKSGYELKSQFGTLYFPISENKVSVTYDIKPIGSNSAGLVNLRDVQGNTVFSDYSCSENGLGGSTFVCNRILLGYPAYADWSEDMLPFLTFGR